MADESKLGILSGVAVVMLVAVFLQAKPSAGKASIGDEATPVPTAPAASNSERPTTPANPPAGVRVPETHAHTIWKSSEPREVKPVSRDPLLWP
jgi:hypothetical protein